VWFCAIAKTVYYNSGSRLATDAKPPLAVIPNVSFFLFVVGQRHSFKLITLYMTITPSDFKVTKWFTDDNVISGMKYIKVKPDLGAGHIIGASDLNGTPIPMIILGVQWVLDVIYREKNIIEYGAQDSYWARTSEMGDKDSKIIEMIKASHKRVSNDFNEKIKSLNVKVDMEFPELEQEHIDFLLSDLTAALKSKGV